MLVVRWPNGAQTMPQHPSRYATAAQRTMAWEVPWCHKSGFSLTPLGTPDSEQMGTRLKADSERTLRRLQADCD